MGRHTSTVQTELNPVVAACVDYRLRLGWPVRVDDDEGQVLLLTGEALANGLEPASRVVVVDMPGELGSRVSAVLWTRSLPAVVFATQRLAQVHPYIFTRWRFLAAADDSKRYDDPTLLCTSLLDVQVLRGPAVRLPLRRLDKNRRKSTNGKTPKLEWIQPPPTGTVVISHLLPRLTAVLAAVCDVVARNGQDAP